MATQTKLILVTGATGQQGGAVARALMSKGQKIRVMTRHPEKAAGLAKAGAEVVKGDLQEGMAVVIGESRASDGEASGVSNPFAPQFFKSKGK